ncbi:VQ motif-containing protein 4-like [Salvia splendens]|uniref:VQ motif-containing protein 4-like n=1 Tax=Salvia splendens TaxID=180675 RepID=UPI001C27BA07|nr:VQ motif-containing protein 4-like [Salvia splendens]
MEITSPSSPREKSSPTNSSSSTTNTSLPLPTPPPTPKPRSHDPNNPYPTTFVQADTSTFKQVVQMLTGSTKPDPPSTPRPASASASGLGIGIPPIKKKQGFKLYERRNSIKNGLIINTFSPNSNSPNCSISNSKSPGILSPSILDFPALMLSPVTPAINEEERAIADKKFYFHPSPRTAPEPPQLLPLFPVTSPRASTS